LIPLKEINQIMK